MKNRVEMPLQEAEKRVCNFDEVALGYTKEQAKEEAQRCLGCPNPRCVAGCPVNVDIPKFINCVKNDDIDGAYQVISQSNTLPAVCGRVCPQESQCEGKCVLGIKGQSVAIGNLERYVADHASNATPTESQSEEKRNDKQDCGCEQQKCQQNDCECQQSGCGNKNVQIAVVGSGPAGLSCAGELTRLGYSVTIFEALSDGGGVLTYGIPSFRLPKSIVQKEIDTLMSKGVQLVINRIIGRNEKVEELFENGYSAVFIASGAGLPNFMNIEGEMLCGVFSANEYLTRVNLMKANQDDYETPLFVGKNVVVVGGGNVAMDAARVALRLGGNVHIVYRRSEQELPARREEVIHAKEEGIIFDLLCNPVRILGDQNNFVCGVECVRMKLGEADASGRARPVVIEGSKFTLAADCVIMAIGTSPNPLIRQTTPQILFNKWGCVEGDQDGATTMQGVYAGGDCLTGAATVISAMGAGKRSALAIHRYLCQKTTKG